MFRFIRAATAAAILTSGLCSVGCVTTGSDKPTLGDRWRNAVDPCYPERYNHAARQAVIAPFAQQVHNGHVLNQTIYTYYFESGTDKLTSAGMEKLDSLARTRPSPDPKIYLQTARDFPAGTDAEKLPQLRSDLDNKRADAIRKYLAAQPAFAPIAYEIYVHDTVTPGIYSEFAGSAYRGSAQGYVGGITGGAGGNAAATGGGATLNQGGGNRGAGAGAGAGAAPGAGGGSVAPR